jgi:hypothetical protein
MKIEIHIDDAELKAFLGELIPEGRPGTARKAPGAARPAKTRSRQQTVSVARRREDGGRVTQPAAIPLPNPPLMAAIWAYCKRADVDIHPGEIAHYFRAALGAGDDGQGNVIGHTTPQAERHYKAIIETWRRRFADAADSAPPSMAAMVKAIDDLVPKVARVRDQDTAA